MHQKNTSLKNSLVTGGLQGIGRAIVHEFIKRGDRVFVFDLAPKDDPRVQELEQTNVQYLQVDVSCVQAIKKGFEVLVQKLQIFENKNLDTLVCCAGITRDMLALRLSEQAWGQVLDVNLKGAFFCAQQALTCFSKQGPSYLVTIGSVVGQTGNPGQAHYAASKAGLVAMTKSIGLEYAKRGLRANVVAPGFIQTSMTEKLSEHIKNKILDQVPLKALGTPEDVAACVEFLTSGKADYISGQVISVNGGMI